MKEDWNDFKFFLGVAKQGTLKNAANALNVNVSTVFRRINALEEKLGARLFERAHDGFRVTESGKIMVEHVLSMQEQAEGVIRRVKDTDKSREGVIRITTSDSVFQSDLFSFIDDYCEQNPGISFEFVISPREYDLAKREVDVALSVGNSRPDYMIGRRLKKVTYRVYGLNTLYDHEFSAISELENYPILTLNQNFSHQPFSLWLSQNISKYAFSHVGDKFTTLQKMIKLGLGIGLLPDYLGDSDEQLKPLFTLPDTASKELWFLIHPDLKRIQRIKDFMDATYNHFKKRN
jgi:DNA-binding transcriptional LysR family regulator